MSGWKLQPPGGGAQVHGRVSYISPELLVSTRVKTRRHSGHRGKRRGVQIGACLGTHDDAVSMLFEFNDSTGRFRRGVSQPILRVLRYAISRCAADPLIGPESSTWSRPESGKHATGRRGQGTGPGASDLGGKFTSERSSLFTTYVITGLKAGRRLGFEPDGSRFSCRSARYASPVYSRYEYSGSQSMV
jgi:hypothetical protein